MTPLPHRTDSAETFSDLPALCRGQRLEMPTFGGGWMSILPFGDGDPYAHALFMETKCGSVVDSAVFSPSELGGLATDAVPLNHARRVAPPRGPDGGLGTPAEARKAIRGAMAKPEAEADPGARDPETIQSPAEADIFRRLDSEKLVRATLEKIFAGQAIKPGSLVDTTFMDAAKTKPVLQNIFYVNPQGTPIPKASSLFVWGPTKPYSVTVISIDSVESKLFRRVTIEQTLKSTSFSAGLVVGQGATGPISSGPGLGDTVSSKGAGRPAPGGGTLQFNAGFVKSYARLRIEARLEVYEKLGQTRTQVINYPA
ncbi:MAG: hypothetical protein AAGF23_03345 [Acidobacteriota bacterium]